MINIISQCVICGSPVSVNRALLLLTHKILDMYEFVDI